jgi:predicted nuclease of predicted toxin-antitoxin system
MGISMSAGRALHEAGEEAVHLCEQGLLQMPDDQILMKAREEDGVILTFDLDFGELLAAAGGAVPSVILFRTHHQTPAAVTPRLFQVLDVCREALKKGAIIIAEDASFRVRYLPIC